MVDEVAGASANAPSLAAIKQVAQAQQQIADVVASAKPEPAEASGPRVAPVDESRGGNVNTTA